MINLHRLVNFRDGDTVADHEREVLRAALRAGVVVLNPDDPSRVAQRLIDRGCLVTFDRLGRCAEITPEGHRRLAEVDPDYQPPTGLFVADRWNDPEALLCRAAYLLGTGASEVRRPPGAVEMSPAAAAVVMGEAQRLRDTDAAKE